MLVCGGEIAEPIPPSLSSVSIFGRAIFERRISFLLPIFELRLALFPPQLIEMSFVRAASRRLLATRVAAVESPLQRRFVSTTAAKVRILPLEDEKLMRSML